MPQVGQNTRIPRAAHLHGSRGRRTTTGPWLQKPRPPVSRGVPSTTEDLAKEPDEPADPEAAVFLIRVALRCAHAYLRTPGNLFRAARNGDLEALEQLLRLDKAAIFDLRATRRLAPRCDPPWGKAEAEGAHGRSPGRGPHPAEAPRTEGTNGRVPAPVVEVVLDTIRHFLGPRKRVGHAASDRAFMRFASPPPNRDQTSAATTQSPAA